MSFLIDTNILIYHTAGSAIVKEFLADLITAKAFNISMITRIEFLGWHAQTPDGFEKCQRLVKLSNVLPVTEEVADKAIDLRRYRNVKLADAIIAATAVVNDLKLATRNPDDFKGLTALKIVNPFK
ncbi:MAG: type II toxin-antitoxin system VapC family toxin [Deltaproteobacteria bacterium]|nr:type II toxin-antitoxin system VapC family toxin [Deltaproteobacteria bacterium]